MPKQQITVDVPDGWEIVGNPQSEFDARTADKKGFYIVALRPKPPEYVTVQMLRMDAEYLRKYASTCTRPPWGDIEDDCRAALATLARCSFGVTRDCGLPPGHTGQHGDGT